MAKLATDKVSKCTFRTCLEVVELSLSNCAAVPIPTGPHSSTTIKNWCNSVVLVRSTYVFSSATISDLSAATVMFFTASGTVAAQPVSPNFPLSAVKVASAAAPKVMHQRCSYSVVV